MSMASEVYDISPRGGTLLLGKPFYGDRDFPFCLGLPLLLPPRTLLQGICPLSILLVALVRRWTSPLQPQSHPLHRSHRSGC